jgi:regulatory protein
METKKLLYDYALKLLGGRRYTIAEMQKKLAARAKKIRVATTDPMTGWGTGYYAVPQDQTEESDAGFAQTTEEIETIIARLKEYRFLDDREYASLYIRDHLRRKPQGTMLLKMKLSARGLPKEIIAQALQAAEINETGLAGKIAAKKIKTLRKGSNPAQKQKEKLARFLISRGFGSRAVAETLRAFPSDGEEDYRSP